MQPKLNLPTNASRTPDKPLDATGEYPALCLKVLIVGNCFKAGAVRMFAQAGCTLAASIEEAELIVFLGGEDIDPALYGEKPHHTTYFNRARDDAEMDIFTKALGLGIPMFGICRGMQFLHAMNGGKLYQDVSNHAGRNHDIRDERTGEVFEVSSMHHQMCIPNKSTFPLAYAAVSAQSGRYATASGTLSTDKHDDLEAAVYPDINSLAVQGHPEVEGTPRFRAWCLELIDEWLEDAMGGIGDNSSAEPERLKELPFMKVGVSN